MKRDLAVVMIVIAVGTATLAELSAVAVRWVFAPVEGWQVGIAVASVAAIVGAVVGGATLRIWRHVKRAVVRALTTGPRDIHPSEGRR